MPDAAVRHVDVLIVGAGLSGIGAACQLQARCPGRSYAVLESRDRSGGTWDLFRYPGVRSDSDMYTLGYSFRPWAGDRAIADGASILQYLRETAAEHGVDRHIRYGHRVLHAAWSTADARWRVDAMRGDEPVRLSCSFLFVCSGYYRYDAGHTPAFEGMADFAGRIVHPQQWPDHLDCSAKRVVVIGSGATAMTLVPELAKTAAHVTLLQRSPTYVVSRPGEDRMARRMARVMPRRWAHGITRWKNVLLGSLLYQLSRRRPEGVKKLLLAAVRRALPPGYDVATHFTPHYGPWDQRLCVVPDGDLFEAIGSGRASMVTDTVARFTPGGLRLASGIELAADVIVTATGLEMQVLGGMTLDVDGRRVDPARTFNYKGLMFGDVPNMASIFGYTNASWTLKSDLAALYVCRLLNHMAQRGYAVCTPRSEGAEATGEPWLDLSSGYVRRAMDRFPQQGARAPWQLQQNYLRDMAALRFGAVDDGVMVFAKAQAGAWASDSSTSSSAHSGSH